MMSWILAASLFLLMGYGAICCAIIDDADEAEEDAALQRARARAVAYAQAREDLRRWDVG
jgi:hypothetical protein